MKPLTEMQLRLVQELGPLLAQATGEGGASTTSIKQATDALNRAYRANPAQVVPALVEIALSTSSDAIRQLAAVQARNRVQASEGKGVSTALPAPALTTIAGWEKCSPPARTAVKERLLGAIQAQIEPKPVFRALCHSAQAIYSLEYGSNSWPAFLPALFTLCTTPTTQESGLFLLLGVLDEMCTPSLRPEIATPLFGLLANAIAPAQPLAIRLLATRALGRLVQNVEPDDQSSIGAMSSMVPAMLQVCTDSLRSGEETNVSDAYEQLDALALCEAPALLNPHFTDVIANCLQGGAATDVDPSLRLAPCNALFFLVKYRRNRVQTLQLGKPILEGLMPIASQDEPEDDDEDSPPRIALRVIEVLASVLPPAQVAPPLLDLCSKCASSSDPRQRRAAVRAFGQIIDGCSLYLQPLLPQIWPLLDNSLADGEIMVRKAGCHALASMTGQLGTEVAARHSIFVPLVVNLVGHPETQQVGLQALDTLLECLEPDDIAPYLQPLMEQLLSILPGADHDTQMSVIGAIGSAAHASKKTFFPYFATTMSHLMPIIQHVPNEDDQSSAEVRGVAQDTIGTLAVSVGRECFDPYFAQCMKLAIEATALKSAGLRECSFTFFTVVSRVYKADMAQFLPTIMPLLIACIAQEEGDITKGAVADKVAELQNGVNDDEDEFEDIEVSSEDLFGASTALMLEQEVAVQAIGELFESIGQEFVPYLETCVKTIDMCLDNSYEGVRKAAVQAYATYIRVGFTLSGAAKPETASIHAPQLPDTVHRLCSHVVPAIVKIMPEEDDTGVVQAVLEEFSDLLTTCGAAVVQPASLFSDICQLAITVLERKHACQVDPDDDEAPANTELAEWDAALIRSAQDLVASIAGALGPDFAQNFAMLLQPMAQYFAPQRESAERAGTIGSLAECCNGLQSGVTPFTDVLFGVFSQALADPELDVRSNAAYAAGVLLFHSDVDLSQHYLSLLGALRPLFYDPAKQTDDDKQARDNAAGAVARMILKNASALPLDQVAPVLLSSLPISSDYVENIKVVPALTRLAALAPEHAPHIVQIFKQMLIGQRHAVELAKVNDTDVVTQVTRESREHIAAYVATLPPDQSSQFAGLL